MPDMSHIKEGDTVHVHNGRGFDVQTVAKVGRTLIHVGEGYQRRSFRREDGSFNGDSRGHGIWIRTPEQDALEDRRRAAVRRVNGTGLRYDPLAIDSAGNRRTFSKFSTEQVERLADLLEALEGELE